MSKFVVCSTFLEGCASDPGLFSDVLFEFPKDNSLTVCIDAPNGSVIQSYKEAAERDQNNLIASWLHCMINRSALTFENLDVALNSKNMKFFELALILGSEVPLLVWTKGPWQNSISHLPEVWVLDRIEAKAAVKKITRGKTISRLGNGKKKSASGVTINGNSINIGNINSRNSRSDINIASGKAIIDLEEKYGKSESLDILKEVHSLQAELRSQNPNKGVVEKVWERLSKLAPDVTTIASAVSAVSAIIGSA